jgi:hypothetical protein
MKSDRITESLTALLKAISENSGKAFTEIQKDLSYVIAQKPSVISNIRKKGPTQQEFKLEHAVELIKHCKNEYWGSDQAGSIRIALKNLAQSVEVECDKAFHFNLEKRCVKSQKVCKFVSPCRQLALFLSVSPAG